MSNVVYAYTRENAIEDGVLVDVTETAKEAGIRFPVALTAAVWADAVDWQDKDGYWQDEAGRLWDVLYMAAYAMRTARQDGNELIYNMMRVPKGKKRAVNVQYKLIVGPGDNMEPVITILLPRED